MIKGIAMTVVRLLPRIILGTALILIFWGCTSIPGLHEGEENNFVRLPFVRVLLENDTPDLKISCNGSFILECLKGEKSSIYYASQQISFKAERGLLTAVMKHGKIDGKYDEILISPRGGREFLAYGGHRYRGMFRIIPHGVGIRLINIVHMEDYLKGVVPPEIGKVEAVDLEAVKAQAVAARTYSMGHLGQYSGEPYDMRSDVADQLYQGVEVEVPFISEAAESTRGYVVKFEDNLINAYYHSTCGGYTDDIEEVWDKPSAPYLRAANDSGICGWSKYYNWRESYSAEQLKMRIEQYLSADRGREIKIGDLIDITVTERTAGGRVAVLIVKTESGDYTFGKDKIRWVFKRSSNPELILQSARFNVSAEHNSAGKLTRVELNGGGYGHGVGMCQCGALGMARQGKKFDQILTFYYRNTHLVRLY
jgi:stage II sporulation protein D